MLSLYKLEIFALVVQEGSFSAAAARLFMTQSAVSQHIQSLEAGLGTKLFRRGRRGVTLTTAGGTLYEYTREILRLVAEAETTITNVEHLESGQVHIGATPGVSVYLLPEWMQRFQRRYPNLTISLQTAVTEEVVSGVLDHSLDVGFIEGELKANVDDRLGRLILQQIKMLVIIGKGHAWWNRTAVPIEALHEHPFITRQHNSRTRQWIDSILARHRIVPRVIAEFDNPESIKQAVISGMGVTILPEYAVRGERERGHIRALEIDDLPLHRNLKIVWDKSEPCTPVTRAFLNRLTDDYPQLIKMLA